MKFYLIYPISENILNNIKIGNLILHADESSVNPLPTDFVYSVDIHKNQVSMNSDGTYQLHPPYREETYPVKVYKNGLGQIIKATEAASYQGVMFNSPRERPALKSISYEGIEKELKIISDYMREYSAMYTKYQTALLNNKNLLKKALADSGSPLAGEPPELRELRSEALKKVAECLNGAVDAEKKLLFLSHLTKLATEFQLISKIILINNEMETEHSHVDPHNRLKNKDVASMIRTLESEWRALPAAYSDVLSDIRFKEIYEALDSLTKENLIQLKLRKGILDVPHQTTNFRAP